MTLKSTPHRRRWRSAAAAAICVAAVAAGSLVAAPATAAEALAGTSTSTTVRIQGDLQLTSITYDLRPETGSPASGAVPGPRSTSTSTTWSVASVGGSIGSMTGRIVDFATTTDYWVMTRTTVDGDEYRSDCRIFRGEPTRGGVVLDPDEESPYLCESTSATVPGADDAVRAWTESFRLASLDWATVRGAITPHGRVSLQEGYLESPSTRFIVDGRWYPKTGTAQEQAPYLSVASNTSREWSAFERNGEAVHAPTGYFSYRIVDAGVPTRFWVKGMAQNLRHVQFNHTGECEIWDGDPRDGGKPDVVSPYTCDANGSNLDGRGDWKVDFDITAATIHDVAVLEAGPLFEDGCSAENATCYFLATKKEPLLGKGQPLGPPYANTGDTPVPYEFRYATGRSSTNSFHVAVGFSLKAGDIAKFSIETTYGYEWTDETEQKWVASMDVPPHTVGAFSFAPAYLVFTGDYLFQVGDEWYRVAGGTFTYPDDENPGYLTNSFSPLHPNYGGAQPGTTPLTPLNPPLAGLTPGASAASGDTAAAGTVTHLAATGGGDAGTTLWAALIGLLAGGALLSARVIARHRRRGAAA